MEKKILPKLFFLIALAVIAFTILAAFMNQGQSSEVASSGPPRAVIIDQLSEEYPNNYFYQEATKYLEGAGYQVDIIPTKDVTVDFYKNLPEMNYKFVIIRTHGANNEGGNEVVLFTGEKYTEDKYIQEQLFGLVKKAAPILQVDYTVVSDEKSEWVIVNDTYRYLSTTSTVSTHADNAFFAISPKMVESMNGKFKDTIFLLGGCNTLSNPSMAKALVSQGAAAVAGWDAKISSQENDYTLLKLLENMLENDLELGKAIDDTQSFFYGSVGNPPVRFVSYT